jgi:L-arabinose isomerase
MRARSSPPTQDFARIAGIELLTIDIRTTVRGFENEVRWNQAYYRLAEAG